MWPPTDAEPKPAPPQPLEAVPGSPAASPAPPPVAIDAPLVWSVDFSAPDRQLPWLWQGYLAPGDITLLTSQWKSGKTTLISILLARLKAGGELAGLPLTPGKALVITEESTRLWRLRHHKLQFGDNVCWLCRPFRGGRTWTTGGP
jgi:hypothetical protein